MKKLTKVITALACALALNATAAFSNTEKTETVSAASGYTEGTRWINGHHKYVKYYQGKVVQEYCWYDCPKECHHTYNTTGAEWKWNGYRYVVDYYTLECTKCGNPSRRYN